MATFRNHMAFSLFFNADIFSNLSRLESFLNNDCFSDSKAAFLKKREQESFWQNIIRRHFTYNLIPTKRKQQNNEGQDVSIYEGAV